MKKYLVLFMFSFFLVGSLIIYMILQESELDDHSINEEVREIENNDEEVIDKSIQEEITTEKDHQVSIDLSEIKSETMVFEPIFKINSITDNILKIIDGVSYTENSSIDLVDLRYLEISYYDFNLEPAYGEIICHERVADEIIEIFKLLYEAKYPIEKVKLVDYYNADDDLSMLDNNTHMFNYRVVAGSQTLSNHAYGLAIDINPMQNPYVRGQVVSPLGSEQYLDRELSMLGMIYKNDILYNAFISYGWKWGGDWNSLKDYQHFEKIIDGINN